MASRISWTGLVVGTVVGAIARVGMTALHFPGILGEQYMVGLYAALVGAVVGGLAGVTGRAVRGTVVGAGLSVLFFLLVLPFAGLFSFLGVGTLPAWWQILAVGAIPGAIGGGVGQMVTKRSGAAPLVRNS